MTNEAPPKPANAVEEQAAPQKRRLSTIIISYDHDTRQLNTKVVAKDQLTVFGMLERAKVELAHQELIDKIALAAEAPRIVAPGSAEGVKTSLAAGVKPS